MDVYQKKELCLLFNAGDLLDCYIAPAPMEQGFVMHFNRRTGAPVSIASFRDREKVKVYRKTSSALSAAKEIGFGEATVSLR